MGKDIGELHPEKIDTLVGFKTTKTEKQELEAFCDEEDFKMSRFCRYAVTKVMVEEKAKRK
jgi:hypothetical protein